MHFILPFTKSLELVIWKTLVSDSKMHHWIIGGKQSKPKTKTYTAGF